MNASQLNLLSEDMFSDIKKCAEKFQNDLTIYTISHQKELNSYDSMAISTMSLEAGNVCFEIAKAVLSIKKQ